MKQIILKGGNISVQDVPPPTVEPGAILVQVEHSCISTGTEMSGMKVGGMALWKRVAKQPDKAKFLLQMALVRGVASTYSFVRTKLSAESPMGYSAAGTVLQVGEGVDDLQPGHRVACAGSQYSHHAEIICVPRNLVVSVPEKVDSQAASTVALGAIALQGVRRAQPTIGEHFVVIGLGVLGQLTAQILLANGCRVIGVDLDRARLSLAQTLGVAAVLHPDDGDQAEQVARLTDGVGADGVIIAATTPSEDVVSTAFHVCRKKGRVVLVGNVGLNLNRNDFYEKELDFLISTSYGPGRYDRRYEEVGLDYPVAYVRWTENRNMTEYLRMVNDGTISIAPLVAGTCSLDQAPMAYARLRTEEPKPIMMLLSYPQTRNPLQDARVSTNPLSKPTARGLIRLAVVGAGEFVKAVHLPNLQSLSDLYKLQAIVTRSGHNAAAIAHQCGACYATTDYREVLCDPEVDAVLIATRHHLHASMTLEALKAGKHVFVEKPLAITETELDAIRSHCESVSLEGSLSVLMTGFNRRFSDCARRIHELTRQRSNPMMLHYRMNAGYVPLDHWVHSKEGGGRNLGEACHVYDLFTYLVGRKVVDVQAKAIVPNTGYYTRADNFTATMSFEDGSVASLVYTALGTTEYAKERMEIFFDGKVLILDDYKSLTVTGTKEKGVESRFMKKGHKQELELFARAVREDGEWPIPLWQQVQASEIALRVEHQLRGAS